MKNSSSFPSDKSSLAGLTQVGSITGLLKKKATRIYQIQNQQFKRGHGCLFFVMPYDMGLYWAVSKWFIAP
jgi:hypothetical protein